MLAQASRLYPQSGSASDRDRLNLSSLWKVNIKYQPANLLYYAQFDSRHRDLLQTYYMPEVAEQPMISQPEAQARPQPGAEPAQRTGAPEGSTQAGQPAL